MKYFYDTEFIEDGKTIELLSIGIISADGREFYAENSEADLTKANDWVRENVLPFLGKNRMTKTSIRDSLEYFCQPTIYGKPQFWGYYSAYDHVALCQLFGTMMDLPKGWPMYTKDLKQWCDSLNNPRLPEQGKGEHHALADAKWNKTVFEFLWDIANGID